MKATPRGWMVTKDDTILRRGGKICGTRVGFSDGRFVRFAGRMTQREAVRQATEHLRREDVLNASPAPAPFESQMRTYCDCGDYCAWCRPDLCVPSVESALEQARRTRTV